MRERQQESFLASIPGGGEGVGGLVPARALLRHRSMIRVLDQVRRVRYFFPELLGLTIRVGLTRAARGYASTEEMTVWMNPHRLSHLTVAHELVHLVQNRGLIPGGEKTADLHALARHRSLVDDLPGYLAVPAELRRRWDPENARLRKLIHETARASLAESEGRPRRAIHRFEKNLIALWRRDRLELLPETTRSSQEELFRRNRV